MYAIIYVFIFQIVIFNYISHSTSVNSEITFPFSVKNKKLGNRLKQIHHISNSDEGTNSGAKSYPTQMSHKNKITLPFLKVKSQYPIHNISKRLNRKRKFKKTSHSRRSLASIFGQNICLKDATDAMLAFALKSYKCFINVGDISKAIREEISCQKSMMERSLTKITREKSIIGKIFAVPKTVTDFVNVEVKKVYALNFIKKFIKTSKDCTNEILANVKSKIVAILFDLGVCVGLQMICRWFTPAACFAANMAIKLGK